MAEVITCNGGVEIRSDLVEIPVAEAQARYTLGGEVFLTIAGENVPPSLLTPGFLEHVPDYWTTLALNHRTYYIEKA
jgi:hypothetical protein